jgi:hypothetical protein
VRGRRKLPEKQPIRRESRVPHEHWHLANARNEIDGQHPNNKYIESVELFGKSSPDRLNSGQRQSAYKQEEMSMPPKGKKKPTKTWTTAAQMTEAPSEGNSMSQEKIRCRAYELYLEHGEQPGRELEDWLQAERELGHSLFLRAQET